MNNCLKYREKRILTSNNVTVSYGEVQAGVDVSAEAKVIGEYTDYYFPTWLELFIGTKGVAKLCEGDTYDMKAGNTVARCKARIHADKEIIRNNEKIITAFKSIIQKVEDYNNDLKTHISNLEDKISTY